MPFTSIPQKFEIAEEIGELLNDSLSERALYILAHNLTRNQLEVIREDLRNQDFLDKQLKRTTDTNVLEHTILDLSARISLLEETLKASIMELNSFSSVSPKELVEKIRNMTASLEFSLKDVRSTVYP